MLRAANLPAAAERQEQLEVKLNALIKASEDRSKIESERAEREEKRYSKLEKAHNDLAVQLTQITAVLPRIESIHASFADFSKGVQTLNTSAEAISSDVAELKNHADATQLSLTGLFESVSEASASVRAVDSAVAAVLDKTQVVHDLVTNGQADMSKQLDLFGHDQSLIADGITSLSKAIEPLATRQDVTAAVESSSIRTRRRIKAVSVLAHRGGDRILEAQKTHSRIILKTTKAVDPFVKQIAQRVIQELSASTKDLTAIVAESASEIQDSKATLRAGSDAIVKAQRGLLEIGPFAENQITASMNLVVTTIAPQVTNMFKALIESSGLNSFQAVSNQIELMIDETGQHIESIRRVGELVVASNNNTAASNVDLLKEMDGFKAVANALESRLAGEEVVEAAGKVERASKVFTRNLEDYKGALENVFANLTNVLVNRLGGELDELMSRGRMSEQERDHLANTIAEVAGNLIMSQIFEDARKDA